MTADLVFDLIASATAMALTAAVYFWRLRDRAEAAVGAAGAGYAVALFLGAALCGYGLGTLNLILTGAPGLGRSILGELDMGGAPSGLIAIYAAIGLAAAAGAVWTFRHKPPPPG